MVTTPHTSSGGNKKNLKHKTSPDSDLFTASLVGMETRLNPVRSLGWISSCCNDTWESVRYGADPCNARQRPCGHNKDCPQGWDIFYWTIPNTFGQYCKIKTLRLQKQMFSHHPSGFLLSCHVRCILKSLICILTNLLPLINTVLAATNCYSISMSIIFLWTVDT